MNTKKLVITFLSAVAFTVMVGCEKRTETVVTTPSGDKVVVETTQKDMSKERTMGESVDDTAVTAKVKANLMGDSQYKFPDVKVTTFKGTVQLSGFVDTRDQVDRAMEVAKKTDGVKEVKNEISLKK